MVRVLFDSADLSRPQDDSRRIFNLSCIMLQNYDLFVHYLSILHLCPPLSGFPDIFSKRNLLFHLLCDTITTCDLGVTNTIKGEFSHEEILISVTRSHHGYGYGNRSFRR